MKIRTALLLLVALPAWIASARPGPRPALAARLAEGPEVIGIVHWGLNTYTDREWGFGDEDPAMLNPGKFDADQIVGACKAGGIGGLIVVAKHHDGFCLWPTKTTEHNISKTPFWKGWSPKLELEKGRIPLSNSNSELELKHETGRDYVKEMEQACRRAGLKFGVYVSPWDRNSAAYGTEKYVSDVFHRQIKELLSGDYGEIFEMWFDGANGGDGWYGGAKGTRKIGVAGDYYRYGEVFRFVRALQPKVTIFAGESDNSDFRWPGNERGLLDPESRATVASTGGFADGKYGNPAYKEQINTGAPDGLHFRVCEADFPLRRGWFYHERERGTTKSAAYLTKLYLSSVGNGGTMNIGIAPDKSGLLDAADVGALAGFGIMRKALFAHEAEMGGQFNVVVMEENLSNGEQVDEWEFVSDGKAILRGKSIGRKRIRLLEEPCVAKDCNLRVLKDGGSLKGVSFKLYNADGELVKAVLSATGDDRETDTAKWMTAAAPDGRPSPARKQRNYLDTTWWDPIVEDIADVDTYLRRKFRQDVTDGTTGLSQRGIASRLGEIVAEAKASGESWRITKAKCFAAEVMEQSIDVSPLDWFPAIAIWDRLSLPIWKVTKSDRAAEVNARMLPEWVKNEWGAGNRDGSWNMWQDFDHSVPDWRVIVKLGFPGMKARLGKYAVKGDPFYDGLAIAMDAMLAGIDRFIEQGRKNLKVGENSSSSRKKEEFHSPTPTLTSNSKSAARLKKEIACLERLRNGPPQTAYDTMMFIWLYFFWSEHLDGIQCRSLTELDVFLTPCYEADLAAGRTTEAEFREQLKHFLWQWGSVNNYWNQPVGFGGTKKDGSSEFNHVSKIILEVMDECALSTPKFLVKVAPNTPDWVMDKMLDMARRHRSISFIGEEPTAKALKKWSHASDEDCRTMVVRGCYEFGLRDSVNGTGVGHVNFLKVVEKMLGEVGDRDFETFSSFKAEYLRRLADVTARCRRVAFEFEKVLPEVNPANLMTLSTEHALKTRRDGFATGCPRGNNSSILSVGLGTTVDALLAVKELVYEKKEMSLSELGKIMAANWEGHEPLRLRMLRSKRKWGNNDPEANALGAELIDCYAAQLNGKPNSRGGVFLASGHCARQYIHLGAKTGATPDGRKAGEEMSKNLSPTMGADTEGATALVATLAASDVTKLPADYPLDMMLHPSVCAGEKGLMLMKALVRQFHKNGGSVIQFTVFSAEELRDAQAHPEKYENLQVRVCGWNVRWNDMSKAEQDAYIRRAENVMKGW